MKPIVLVVLSVLSVSASADFCAEMSEEFQMQAKEYAMELMQKADGAPQQTVRELRKNGYLMNALVVQNSMIMAGCKTEVRFDPGQYLKKAGACYIETLKAQTAVMMNPEADVPDMPSCDKKTW